MLKHKIIFIVMALASSYAGAFAQNKPEVAVHGFVRSFYTTDTRLSKSGTAELYYYVPMDNKFNSSGEDLNAVPTSKWSSLTSRLWVDSFWKSGDLTVKGKIEADFYSGLSGVTGTATFRLRQAYFDMLFKGYSLRFGQAWHPMAADMPDCIALEIAVPFGPFSRTPQITANLSLGGKWSIAASLLWQMQYTSAGPEGASANYIKYSGAPESYLGVNYKNGGFLGRIGTDVLTIKPRYKGKVDGVEKLVSDNLTTVSGFVYLQYKKGLFSAKLKSTLAEAGEHLNMLGGYGISAKYDTSGEDGHYEYTPTLTSSTWASFAYGKTTKFSLLLGYAKCFGTLESLFETSPGSGLVDASSNYLAKNTYSNLNSTYRVAPCLSQSIGPIVIAFEYTYSAAQYGDYKTTESLSQCVGINGLARENLHWVGNHRFQLMAKYTF